jgi:hypothetical protein
MLNALKNNRIKVLGMLMVAVTLSLAMTLAAPPADASGGGCPWCTFWNGGPVCLSPGQTSCYFGSHLQCVCDPTCHMSWIGTC